MFPILIFILIISILVLLHEFGHFIMAKRAGIEVEEFGLGLPPRAWGKKIGETIYSINWLPFGGFVKLMGEDPLDARRDDARSYYIKTLGQRMQVVVAGVVVNFLLAVVIFYVVLASVGFKVSLLKLSDHQFKFVSQSQQVLVVNVAGGSPAQEAGVTDRDSIVAAGGLAVNSIDDLQKVIRASENQKVTLKLEDQITNSRREVEVVPKYSDQLKAAAIGVSLGESVVLAYQEPGQKVFSGFIHSYNTLDYSLKVFGQLIGQAFRTKDFEPLSEGVAGPVGIAQLTTQIVQFGPIPLLQLMGLLSLNLAFVNILPIPALDGGRFFFLVVEAFTRKRLYPAVEKWIHTVGFVLLIGLTILITYNDLLKIFK